MNTEVSIADLVALIGVIVVFVKLFLPSVWPSKVDKSTIDHRRADIATKYEKLLDDALARINCMETEMKNRAKSSDTRFAKLKTEVDALREQLRERDQLLDELQDGIDRLIKQLEAHKITPAWTPPERKSKTANT